jgi:hypothetical protein
MDINLKELTIRDVVEGYTDNDEEGVYGYGGKLNIRPKYQREFVYDDKDRKAVINTIRQKFPLNVMYWSENTDGTYEIIDGQQRTISFCQFVNGEFSVLVNGYQKTFGNLTETQQKDILDYPLMVYVCTGTEEDKLEWFRTINIVGKELSQQELRNASFTGTWLTNAKSIFSKTNCAASRLAKDYTSVKVIRQELLELAIKWKNKGDIDGYMSAHQHDPNANELWTYFRNVIEWAQLTFPYYRKYMKSVEWGPLYDQYKDVMYDVEELEAKIKELMMDDDVSDKKGIYTYVLGGDEKHLNIRAFTDAMKRAAYEKQNGICKSCGKHFEFEQMHGDHIVAWHNGGKTNAENCQMLCTTCNWNKSGN